MLKTELPQMASPCRKNVCDVWRRSFYPFSCRSAGAVAFRGRLSARLTHTCLCLAVFTELLLPDETEQDKERTCETLLMCIVTVLSHGLRSGGGVGDVLRKPSKEVAASARAQGRDSRGRVGSGRTARGLERRLQPHTGSLGAATRGRAATREASCPLRLSLQHREGGRSSRHTQVTAPSGWGLAHLHTLHSP